MVDFSFSLDELRRMPVFFMVGMGRSGSTLLQHILDSHDEIAAAPESMFIMQTFKKFKNYKSFSRYDIDQLLKVLKLDRKLEVYWRVNYNLLENNIINLADKGATYQDLCKLILLSHNNSYQQKSSIKIVGEKNPTNTLFMNELISLFPDAKFLFVIREPKDCIASHVTAFKTRKIASIAWAWKEFGEGFLEFSRRHVNNCRIIQYEKIVTDPIESLTGICEFLNVRFQPEQLQFQEKFSASNQEFENSEIFNEIMGELKKAVHDKNIGKWNNILTEEEGLLVDYITWKVAYRFEYKSEKSKNFFFRSLSGKFSKKIEFFIIRNYYRCPYLVKIFFRKISGIIFKSNRKKNYNEQTIIQSLHESRSK
jgi:protein-tyrosine sulfotransferase